MEFAFFKFVNKGLAGQKRFCVSVRILNMLYTIL